MRSRVLQTALVLCALVTSIPAFATAQRTFVASTGNDANPCSLSMPCRGFSAAVAQASPGGEVIVVDSAGYGPVTIAQSVSIVAPAGVYAGITVFSGYGIDIGGGLDTKVLLRGITLNSQGDGTTNGINFTQGATLSIEDCEISNMRGYAINVATPMSNISISGSVIQGNWFGVVIEGVGGMGTIAEIHRTTIARNSVGIWGKPGSSISVSESTIAQNVGEGIRVLPVGIATKGRLAISGSTIMGNGGQAIVLDVGAGAAGDLYAVRNIITENNDNAILIHAAGGIVVTALIAENLIAGNGGHGIRAQGEFVTVTASANQIIRNQGYGMDGDTAVPAPTFFSRSDNTLQGNIQGPTRGTITPLTAF